MALPAGSESVPVISAGPECVLAADLFQPDKHCLVAIRDADRTRLHGVVGGQRMDGTGGFSCEFPHKRSRPRRAVGRPGRPAGFAVLEGTQVGFVAVVRIDALCDGNSHGNGLLCRDDIGKVRRVRRRRAGTSATFVGPGCLADARYATLTSRAFPTPSLPPRSWRRVQSGCDGRRTGYGVGRTGRG